MSQENVENLRAHLESWSGKVGPDIQGAVSRGEIDMSVLDPEVTYDDSALPDHAGETYRGHDGVLRAWEQWSEPFEEVTAELEEIVGVGDRLVSIHRVRVKAQHTGIEFEMPLANLYMFRAGKVIHIRSYRDPEEALEAAGLSE
jgi:ketosteroid isomerase-like protein